MEVAVRSTGAAAAGKQQRSAAVVNRRRGRARRGVALDVALAAGSLVVAVLGGLDLSTGAAVAATLVVAGASFNARTRRHAFSALNRTAYDRLPHAAAAAAAATLAAAIAADVQAAALPGAELIALLVLLTTVQVAGEAVSLRLWARPDHERCLLVGVPDAQMRFMRQTGYTGIRGSIVAALDFDAAHELLPQLDCVDVDRVILVADTPDNGLRAAELAERIRATGATTSLVSPALMRLGAAVQTEQVGASVVAHVTPLTPHPIKRVIDVLGAAAGVAVLSPFLLAVTLIIRRDGGPALFRQVRIGRDGEPFAILKFRTMVPDAEAQKEALRAHNEADGLFKITDDPRITPIGRWLRRTSLDELPQLINVLRGDMSLVGPRPLVPEEDRLVTGLCRNRLRVRPGMTGPWQVMGSARIGVEDMAQLDMLYVNDGTVGDDLRVLGRTAGVVAGRRGM